MVSHATAVRVLAGAGAKRQPKEFIADGEREWPGCFDPLPEPPQSLMQAHDFAREQANLFFQVVAYRILDTRALAEREFGVTYGHAGMHRPLHARRSPVLRLLRFARNDD